MTNAISIFFMGLFLGVSLGVSTAAHADWFFEEPQIQTLANDTRTLSGRVQNENRLSGYTRNLFRNYIEAAQRFTQTCAVDPNSKFDHCVRLLDATWDAFYPINADTGRLQGRRGEFPHIFQSLDAILIDLNWITYKHP